MDFLKRNWATLILIGIAAVWFGINLGTNQCPSCVISEIAQDKLGTGSPAKDEPATALAAAMPSWSVVDTRGDIVSSEGLRGKVGVVVYWATWCGGCKREIPDLVALREEFPESEVEIIGLSIDEAHKDLQRFAETAGINYRIARTNESANSAFGRIDALPTLFIIDRNGRIQFRHTGNMAKEALAERVRSALATSDA